MWAQLKNASVQQANVVKLMQIDMLQLDVLQTQMDKISLQTLLLVGFAMCFWAGETIGPLVEDDSKICIWKTNAGLAFGHLYFYCTATTIACGVVIVSTISYVRQAAQEAALTVSTGAAIEITRQHLRTLQTFLNLAYATFIGSAVLLIALFGGLAQDVRYSDPRRDPNSPYYDPSLFANGAQPNIEGTFRGFDDVLYTECLNPKDPRANAARNSNGAAIATVNTLVIFGFAVVGVRFFLNVRHSYRPVPLLKWFVDQQSQQERKSNSVAKDWLSMPLGTGRKEVNVELVSRAAAATPERKAVAPQTHTDAARDADDSVSSDGDWDVRAAQQ